MTRIAIVVIALTCTPIALAQQANPGDKPLAFEVASVKPNEKTGSYRVTNVPGGGFTARTNAPMTGWASSPTSCQNTRMAP